MKVCVCVGSSCHLKGSYKIIELMKEALAKHGLTDTVELSAAFCLGKCTDGVTVQVGEEIVCGVSADNFNGFFQRYILDRVEAPNAPQSGTA